MKRSAGLLVYRLAAAGPQVLLGHPGGPLWRMKDLGAWGVVKGEIEDAEAPLAAAVREFREETGLEAAGLAGAVALSPIRQKGGKEVLCWLVEADLDLAGFTPGTFEMEWPPRSGRRHSFPEIDWLRYFPADEARNRILPSQAPLLEQALEVIEGKSG